MHFIKSKKLLIFVGLTLLFFVSFFGNLFGTGLSNTWFIGFQEDSASIVRKTAECKGLFEDYSGPIQPQTKLFLFNQQEGCSFDDYAVYRSQYGLQARVLSFFAPPNYSDQVAYFHYIELLLSFLLAVIFAILILKISKIFNMKLALVVASLVLISPWIAAYSRNLYWVTFIMFLPFIFSFMTYEFFKFRSKLGLFYFILGILFFIKFLNGYEHASTLLVSALVPIVFYEFSRANGRKKNIELMRPVLFIFVSGLIALVMAIVVNATGLQSYYKSWSGALEQVTSRVDARSGTLDYQKNVILGFKNTTPHGYDFVDKFYDLDVLKDGEGHPLKYAAISIVSYAMLPAISLPIVFREPLATILQSITFVVIISYFALRYTMKKRYVDSSMGRALTYSFWLSLFGSISWLVLMPGHAYPHVHLNAIIFYMPLLIICYIIIGLFISSIWPSNKLNAKK